MFYFWKYRNLLDIQINFVDPLGIYKVNIAYSLDSKINLIP